MTKKFRTASTQIEVEEWNKYKELCASNGLTPYKDLNEYVLNRLNPKGENKIERIEKGLENRNEGNSSGNSQGPVRIVEAEGDGDPCPFC